MTKTTHITPGENTRRGSVQKKRKRGEEQTCEKRSKKKKKRKSSSPCTPTRNWDAKLRGTKGGGGVHIKHLKKKKGFERKKRMWRSARGAQIKNRWPTTEQSEGREEVFAVDTRSLQRKKEGIALAQGRMGTKMGSYQNQKADRDATGRDQPIENEREEMSREGKKA